MEGRVDSSRTCPGLREKWSLWGNRIWGQPERWDEASRQESELNVSSSRWPLTVIRATVLETERWKNGVGWCRPFLTGEGCHCKVMEAAPNFVCVWSGGQGAISGRTLDTGKRIYRAAIVTGWEEDYEKHASFVFCISLLKPLSQIWKIKT